jgi:hypothetical protein
MPIELNQLHWSVCQEPAREIETKYSYKIKPIISLTAARYKGKPTKAHICEEDGLYSLWVKDDYSNGDLWSCQACWFKEAAIALSWYLKTHKEG